MTYDDAEYLVPELFKALGEGKFTQRLAHVISNAEHLARMDGYSRGVQDERAKAKLKRKKK